MCLFFFSKGIMVAPYALKNEDTEKERTEDSIYYDSLNIWVSKNLNTKFNH